MQPLIGGRALPRKSSWRYCDELVEPESVHFLRYHSRTNSYRWLPAIRRHGGGLHDAPSALRRAVLRGKVKRFRKIVAGRLVLWNGGRAIRSVLIMIINSGETKTTSTYLLISSWLNSVSSCTESHRALVRDVISRTKSDQLNYAMTNFSAEGHWKALILHVLNQAATIWRWTKRYFPALAVRNLAIVPI